MQHVLGWLRRVFARGSCLAAVFLKPLGEPDSKLSASAKTSDAQNAAPNHAQPPPAPAAMPLARPEPAECDDRAQSEDDQITEPRLTPADLNSAKAGCDRDRISERRRVTTERLSKAAHQALAYPARSRRAGLASGLVLGHETRFDARRPTPA